LDVDEDPQFTQITLIQRPSIGNELEKQRIELDRIYRITQIRIEIAQKAFGEASMNCIEASRTNAGGF
jgi:hypothetical protein